MTNREKLLLWLLAAGLFGLVLFGNDPYRYYKLYTGGIETDATVISLTPTNHNSCSFRFNAKGNSYEGSGSIDPLKGKQVGETVRIMYSCDLPSLCADCDTHTVSGKFFNALNAAGIPVLVFPTLVVFIVDRSKREKRI